MFLKKKKPFYLQSSNRMYLTWGYLDLDCYCYCNFWFLSTVTVRYTLSVDSHIESEHSDHPEGHFYSFKTVYARIISTFIPHYCYQIQTVLSNTSQLKLTQPIWWPLTGLLLLNTQWYKRVSVTCTLCFCMSLHEAWYTLIHSFVCLSTDLLCSLPELHCCWDSLRTCCTNGPEKGRGKGNYGVRFGIWHRRWWKPRLECTWSCQTV